MNQSDRHLLIDRHTLASYQSDRQLLLIDQYTVLQYKTPVWQTGDHRPLLHFHRVATSNTWCWCFLCFVSNVNYYWDEMGNNTLYKTSKLPTTEYDSHWTDHVYEYFIWPLTHLITRMYWQYKYITLCKELFMAHIVQ